VIELIVADAVQSYRCLGPDHEVESGTGWTAFSEWCGQPPAAIHFSVTKVTRTNPHVA
jgi:hypothetical protein